MVLLCFLYLSFHWKILLSKLEIISTVTFTSWFYLINCTLKQYLLYSHNPSITSQKTFLRSRISLNYFLAHKWWNDLWSPVKTPWGNSHHPTSSSSHTFLLWSLQFCSLQNTVLVLSLSLCVFLSHCLFHTWSSSVTGVSSGHYDILQPPFDFFNIQQK